MITTTKYSLSVNEHSSFNDWPFSLLYFLVYSYAFYSLDFRNAITKKMTYELTEIFALAVALTKMGNRISTMALQERFDRDKLRAIVEEIRVASLQLA